MRPLCPYFFSFFFFAYRFASVASPVPSFVPFFLMRLDTIQACSLLLFLWPMLGPVMYVIRKEPGQSFMSNKSRKSIEKIVPLIMRISIYARRFIFFFFVAIRIRNIGSAKYKLYNSLGSMKSDWMDDETDFFVFMVFIRERIYNFNDMYSWFWIDKWQWFLCIFLKRNNKLSRIHRTLCSKVLIRRL